MTCIRVPFWYLNVVEPDGTWRADAFTHLDWIVNEAWKRGIYTVLDFHGLPGGDCPWASCGRIQSSGQFFSVYSNQVVAIDIWSKFAAHYKGNPAIAAYDLMNEPTVHPTAGRSGTFTTGISGSSAASTPIIRFKWKETGTGTRCQTRVRKAGTTSPTTPTLTLSARTALTIPPPPRWMERHGGHLFLSKPFLLQHSRLHR